MNNLNNAKSQKIDFYNSDLKSVLKELEEGQYLFIVADKKKAFILLFDKEKLEIIKDFMHTGVGKLVKSDSGELHGRNDKLARHIEKQLHEHIQLLMEQVNILIKGKHVNGVFIGGHKPFHHMIEKELPMELQKIVRGRFVTELNISHEELTSHCLGVLKEYSGSI